MTKEQSAVQKAFGELAPKFADLTDNVLFGEAQNRSTPGLGDMSSEFQNASTLAPPAWRGAVPPATSL